MIQRTNLSVILLVCLSFGLLNPGIINSAYAGQNTDSNEIHGKVTEILEVKGYTYAEVDTGEKKVWAAGPTTPLKIDDMIAFTALMPMKNFHSKSLGRDFSIVYFIDRFITGKEAPTSEPAEITSPNDEIKQEQTSQPVEGINKVEGGNTIAEIYSQIVYFIDRFFTDKETPASEPAEITSPHDEIKQEQTSQPDEGINKVEGGNTIAEIYSQKDDLEGKTVRIRGQVTKFTPEIRGKNWLHIKDSSTLDDLTVTSDSTVAINDIVIIEGKLELDKDFGYGYFYAVILEDVKITKE